MNFTEEEKRQHAEAVIAPDFINQMNAGMNMQNMTSLPSMGYNNMEDIFTKNRSSFHKQINDLNLMTDTSLFPTRGSIARVNSNNKSNNNSIAVNMGPDNMRVTRKRSAHMNKEFSLFPHM